MDYGEKSARRWLHFKRVREGRLVLIATKSPMPSSWISLAMRRRVPVYFRGRSNRFV